METNAKTLALITKNIAGVGTFGELSCNGQRLCVTAEKEWKNNQPSISCIPAGVYALRHHQSPSKGTCLSLSSPNVGVTVYGPSQRTHCLVHVANYPEQLEGCIAPGMHFAKERWGVASSEKAMNTLLGFLPKDVEHTLVIARL